MKTKVLTSLVIAAIMMFAVPLVALAAPAITNFSMDRTTINSGQNITFQVRATEQTQFVFAVADGVRTAGTRVGTTNDWTVVVSPTRSVTVSVFANSTNSETNAAVIHVPVTVGATAATPAPTPAPTVTIPTPPANLGPIAIASITETPATAAGQVQLTVVTGREANEVWVNFNRTANTRGTGEFARATMTSQDTNSRTWVLNFRPATWAAQQVEVGSNRTYNWPGAATQLYTLTLAQPFVPPVEPRILNVSVNNTTITPGANTTFTIRTNADAEHVWVRDVDGREHNATRSSTAGHQRTWTVTFSPARSGNVTIFANSTRNADNAVTRTQNITVAQATAQIIGTPTATGGVWDGQFWNQQTTINVTTNAHAQTVWAVMPGGNRVQLNRTDSGTGNRTWAATVHDPNLGATIVIGVSNQTGNVNNLSADDTRTITRTGFAGGGNILHTQAAQTQVARGTDVTFWITTTTNVNGISVPNVPGVGTLVAGPTSTIQGNQIVWTVTMRIDAGAAQNSWTNFTVHALFNNQIVASQQLQNVQIV